MNQDRSIGRLAALTGLAWGAGGLVAGLLSDPLRSLAPVADPALMDPIPQLILGAVGGMATGVALRTRHPGFRVPQVIGCAVVWGLGLGASAWVSTGLWALALLVYPVLSGLLGGLGTALLLRMSLPGVRFRDMLAVVLGWTLACLAGMVPLLVPAIERILQAASAQLPLIWTIAGGLGAWLTLRRVQRAGLRR